MRTRLGTILSLAFVAVLLATFVLPDTVGASGRTVTLTTKLTGASERPNPVQTEATGKAVVKLNAEEGTICYKLKVKNIGTMIGAHIHEITQVNQTGPIRLHLTIPVEGRSSGCATDPTLAAAIIANPSKYYVNVHTPTNTGGEIRGDLG